MVQVVKVEDQSWLLHVQMGLFCVGFVALYIFMYWRSGGREAFYESKEKKEARWNQVFFDGLGEPELVDLPGAEGALRACKAPCVTEADNQRRAYRRAPSSQTATC
eukprot:5587493-Prymnesium_polylepis.1